MNTIDPNIEIRVGYYGGLLVTSQMIEMQRQDYAMKQYYEQQQRDHDDLIMALQLKSALTRGRIRMSFAFLPLIVLLSIIAAMLVVRFT